MTNSYVLMSICLHLLSQKVVRVFKMDEMHSVVCPFFVLQESVDLGEIMYSLCYLPTAGRMTLTVIKCRNLKAMDITGSSGNPTASKMGLTSKAQAEP